ncbi:[LysW]-aminoadipate semialdehyde/glutamate semialdehyde transaminase [uncultured archaeon]|nr:[LysW]-aminoadipate semialdehyde/glutamate semialdehyde transaminase [uncultured archaeon]
MVGNNTNSSLITLETSHEMAIYPKRGIALVRGSGSHVWDADNKQYIDLTSGIGIAILGHAHPKLAEAISHQASTLLTCNESFANNERARLVERLAALWQSATHSAGRVFLCNSGTEAIEAAMKMARAKTGRKGFVAAMNAFHGRTMGSLSLTFKPKYRERFEPLVGPVVRVRYNDIESLRSAVTSDTAAVFLEVIQGEGGIRPATAEYLRAAREICTAAGALLIIDEIQTGCGRSGKFFAFEHFNLSPDAVTLAKGLGGGVPIGALIAREEVCALKPLEHGSTFGGNPLACAAANATLDIMADETLLARATAEGEWLMGQLRALSSRHPCISEVRGKGLMIGIELKVESKPTLQAAQAKGLLVLASGETVVRLLPPLNTPRADFEQALKILDEVLPS